jgi:hypothetical protein
VSGEVKKSRLDHVGEGQVSSFLALLRVGTGWFERTGET